MTLTPKQKQVLSGIVMAVGTSVAVAIEQALANPPVTPKSLAVAGAMGAFTGLAHYLPTLGTKAAIDAQVVAKVTEVVGKEGL
jgi:zinc transporter ZupT